MRYIFKDGLVYLERSLDGNLVVEYINPTYRVDLYFENDIITARVLDFQDNVKSDYNEPVGLIVDGIEQSIQADNGVAQLSYTAVGKVTVRSNQLDIANTEIVIGEDPDRLDLIEMDNAALMMELAGTNIKLAQTEQALADLMLLVASGGTMP